MKFLVIAIGLAQSKCKWQK